MTETTVIDPPVPIALLDVDNVLDNEYWHWCADKVMTDDGEFILGQYCAAAEEMGAVGRFFFIEEVLRQPNGKIEISWGT